MNEIKTGWLTWEEILPFKEQLIDMELDLMITYHYPEWSIPRSYPEGSVERLKDHLQSGNTFFWGAIQGDKLVGYYWGYCAMFIDKKRWNTRSIYFKPKVKGLGLGKQAMDAAHKKALELHCDEAATEYVPFNHTMENLMKSSGYEIARIEVVKKL